MVRKIVSGIMSILLVLSMFSLLSHIQPVRAQGTIYIRADGSIDPPTAPISSVDNVTYTFTGNIIDTYGIVIERDNIVLDGERARYTLQGTGSGSGNGITLSGRSNVTIKNMTIGAFYYGIYLVSSSGNSISGNYIANNSDGIVLSGSTYLESSENTISGNYIANNSDGIYLTYYSSDNIIYHNDFINNTIQVRSEDYGNFFSYNYWSDYNGKDSNGDGIGDTSYIIDFYDFDYRPLMNPYYWNQTRILPTSANLDIGQSQSFTSSVTIGTPPYTYQWYLNGTPVSGAANPTWTLTPSSSGSYNVYLNVTDNVGFSANSNIATVTVNLVPSVAISPSSAVMNVSQFQLFTSTVSDGTYPYYYQWYLDGLAVSGATGATWAFVPASAGSYTVYLNVTDSVGVIAISNTATVTVSPASSSTSSSKRAPAMWVEPSVVSVPGVVGYRFDVMVWANMSQPCFTWNIDLTFNSTYFAADYASYTAGGSSQFFSGHTTVPAPISCDNVYGSVIAGETLLGLDERSAGSGSLVWVEFEVKAVWSQSQVLSINNYDTFVLDPDLNEIPVAFYDATVNVIVHDVAVTNVASSKTVVGQGLSANMNVTVANQGDYTETFNVTAYANTTSIGTQEVVALPSGNSAQLVFTWNTTSFAYGNYSISAYAWPAPDETNTADNNFTGSLTTVAGVGDLTGETPNLLDFVSDGKVDMKDVGVVARFFGENVPLAPSNCDVTGPTAGVPDGTINMRDVGLVARYFGTNYTYP